MPLGSYARRVPGARVSILPVRLLEEHRVGVLSCTRCFPGLPGAAAPSQCLRGKGLLAPIGGRLPGDGDIVAELGDGLAGVGRIVTPVGGIHSYPLGALPWGYVFSCVRHPSRSDVPGS